MRLLIVTQYFWPETFIINDLVRSFAEMGHVVTVATGKPNYPSGKIQPGYKKRGVFSEKFVRDIDVIRIPLCPRHDGSAFVLSMNFLSFAMSGLLLFPFLLRRQSFDAVLFFGVSPLTAALPALLISRLKKAHLAVWVQDLWPESLSANGYLKSRLVQWPIKAMMRLIYRSSDTLLLQSKAFSSSVSSYTNAGKIVYFPNPAPRAESHESVLPEVLKAHFANSFSIVFAGNLGRSQSLETIIEAAVLLKDHPQIRFILVGGGREEDRLKRRINALKLDNIKMTGHLSRKLMPMIFRLSDALLLTLKGDEAFGMLVPSKTQAYLQAGKPIVAAINGEAARLIKESKSGLVCPAQDSKALAEIILTLVSMPDEIRCSMGLAGRQYFEKYFDIDNVSKELINIIKSRIGAEKND